MKVKISIVLYGILLSSSALANCPEHSTVIYKCQQFQNKEECTWQPSRGWYQGSSSHGETIPEGARATHFLRAFWTPNAHITTDSTLSYGVVICQYSFKGSLIQLFQQDRDVNIPDPRISDKSIWHLEPWQGVKGLGCSAGEKDCHFEYGERI